MNIEKIPTEVGFDLLLADELHGFTPFEEGSAAVISFTTEGPWKDRNPIWIGTRMADPDEPEGWTWELGGTYLNREQAIALRDFLTEALEATK